MKIDPYRHPGDGDPPRWSLPALRKLKGRAMKALRGLYASSRRLVGDDYDRALKALYDLLPPTNLDDEDPDAQARWTSLDAMLREYYGQVFDYDVACTVAREFSGNVDTFRFGRPYYKWEAIEGSLWGLLRVVDMERIPVKGVRYWVQFTVEAGPAAGLTFERILSGSAIRKRLREIGIPKYKHDYPPEMLHDMVFTSWMGIHKDRVVMHDVVVTASTEKHNKALVEARFGPCTGGYAPLKTKCTHLCPFGMDACRYAWHKDTYKLKSARPCRIFTEVGGAVIHHDGLMNKKGKGICIKCIYKGHTEEVIRAREKRRED